MTWIPSYKKKNLPLPQSLFKILTKSFLVIFFYLLSFLFSKIIYINCIERKRFYSNYLLYLSHVSILFILSLNHTKSSKPNSFSSCQFPPISQNWHKNKRKKEKASLIISILLHFHIDIQFLTMIRNVGLSLLWYLIDIKLPLFGHSQLLILIFIFDSYPFLVLYHSKLGIFLLSFTWQSQMGRDIGNEWWQSLRSLTLSRDIHRRHLVCRNRIRRVSWVCWR